MCAPCYAVLRRKSHMECVNVLKRQRPLHIAAQSPICILQGILMQPCLCRSCVSSCTCSPSCGLCGSLQHGSSVCMIWHNLWSKKRRCRRQCARLRLHRWRHGWRLKWAWEVYVEDCNKLRMGRICNCGIPDAPYTKGGFK